MIGFVLRFFKGLILGWLMSLVFFMVKRILARAFGNMPSSNNHQPHTDSRSANQNSNDVVETIWAGMSATQLRATFGTPFKKENVKSGEIWTYANLNGIDTETDVSIKDNQVTNWFVKSTSSK